MIKIVKTYSVLILIFIMPAFILCQVTYIKSISSIKNTRNVFVFSSQNSPIIWESDSLVLSKFDVCGASIWQKQYKFNFDNTSVLKSGFKPLQNGNFAFVTSENQGSHRNSRVTLIDSNGNVIWSKSFRMTNYSLFSNSIMQNGVGELFVYGNANPIGGGASFCFLYKLNRNGTLIWTKSFTLGGTWGGAILTSDQGFLLRNGLKFIKTDANGFVQWSTSIIDLGNYFFSAPIEVKDGYIFCGTNSGSSLSLSFFKIDRQGVLTPVHKKTIIFNSIHRNFINSSDTTFICVLNGNQTRNLPTIFEFDKDLNKLSKNTLHLSGSTKKLTGTSLAFLDDGTPLVSGIVDSSFTYSPYFGVLSSNYKLGCDTTIFDSIFIETVTQTFPYVTSQITNPLILEDTNYTQTSLNYTVSTLCEELNFIVDIGNDTTLCPNTSIRLNNKTSSVFDTYSWSTGETISSITVSNPGIYWVTATNSCFGVTVSDTIKINVFNFPNPLDSLIDTVICKNQYVRINAQVPLGTYKWQDNSTLSYFLVDKPGNYFVDVTSNGCTKRFKYKFTSCSDLYIPNVFSPNTDGINDVFKINYLGFEFYEIKIYNRWGTLVFESKNNDTHWNGESDNKEVAAGVYFYVLTIGEKQYKGNISLFR
jgi:gliding motility-associated-like protein